VSQSAPEQFTTRRDPRKNQSSDTCKPGALAAHELGKSKKSSHREEYRKCM